MSSCSLANFPYDCPYTSNGYGDSGFSSGSYSSAPAHHSWLTVVFSSSPLDIIINCLLVVVVLYVSYRYLSRPLLELFFRLKAYFRPRSDFVFLEITPPDYVDKSPLSSSELISALRETLDGYSDLSLEILASQEQGIRFLVRAAKDNITVIQKHLAAYLTDAKFKVLKDLPTSESLSSSKFSQLFEIVQARHYGFPLKSHKDYSQYDPADFLVGSMTKLEAGETINLQLIVSQHNSRWTNHLHNQILSHGRARLDNQLRNFMLSNWLVWLIAAIYYSLTHDFVDSFAVALICLIINFFLPKKAVSVSANEKRIYDGVLDKLSEPLIKVDMRVEIKAASLAQFNTLVRAFRSSLASYNVVGYQQLQLKPASFDLPLLISFNSYKFRARLPSLLSFNSSVLSSVELASIYHLPYGNLLAEDVVSSHSRSLPVPPAIKNNQFDVVLGLSDYHDSDIPIGLTEAERERHVYIIGGTGNGKTTMLLHSIVQDITNGKGLAIVDPHGDLAETLLRYIPEARVKDVIYFNPRDISHPIGMNLLEVPAGLSGDDLLIEQDFITEAVVSVFRKIFSDEDSGGHRIEHFLRNTIHTAFTVPDATLFTVYKLLTNSKFRKTVTDKLTDEDLIDFWKGEFNTAGDYQKVKMSSGVNAKLGRFQRSAVSRRILEQPHSTINFDDIIQNKKILVCNFSKGQIGEDTSALLGISVLAKLQLAALRRSRMDQADRSPFYLYVDEFQNFATTSFVQLLSEARKYKLLLTMAEQSTTQQNKKRLNQIILANVGTVICFRSGSPADEEILLPLFKPYIKSGEIANLEAFHFYAKLAAIKSQGPVSGETILLEDQGSQVMAEKVKAQSARQYAAVLTENKDKVVVSSKGQAVSKGSSRAIVKEKLARSLPEDN